MAPLDSKKKRPQKEILSADSDEQGATPSSENSNDGQKKSPFSLVSSEPEQDSPAQATSVATGSGESPFQPYQEDHPQTSMHRLGIPQRRPAGQASNFGTTTVKATVNPELSKQPPVKAVLSGAQSGAIMEKLREAGELAIKGQLSSEKAIQIIGQIRALDENEA